MDSAWDITPCREPPVEFWFLPKEPIYYAKRRLPRQANFVPTAEGSARTARIGRGEWPLGTVHPQLGVQLVIIPKEKLWSRLRGNNLSVAPPETKSQIPLASDCLTSNLRRSKFPASGRFQGKSRKILAGTGR